MSLTPRSVWQPPREPRLCPCLHPPHVLWPSYSKARCTRAATRWRQAAQRRRGWTGLARAARPCRSSNIGRIGATLADGTAVTACDNGNCANAVTMKFDLAGRLPPRGNRVARHPGVTGGAPVILATPPGAAFSNFIASPSQAATSSSASPTSAAHSRTARWCRRVLPE